ncbi:hypothetical protein E2L08_12610 [Palleronia sediminis]|uniref:Uncharacterized protein n=1 Tax=Palleronia sediminis TaxID=2547833 RepID=A0A4R6A601_9RHOB|nr:hypothetical protein [Palleronia sediminis]TDL78134.1 hypothetical protein E2L08_12610 [Palleronia sediminis]
MLSSDEVNRQLEASLRALVIDNLPFDRNSPQEYLEVIEMTTNDLLKVWFNWVRRKVPATPRKLFVSNAFWNDEAASANRRDIERMFSCIERGDCLDGFLSKRANQALPLRDKRNNRVELDLLLNDWAVHHLHPNRNDVLVFMFFTTDEAFALIAGKHRDMTSRRMVEAAVETWPEREIFLEMKGTI